MPLGLVEVIGCREITISLRTANYREARRRLLVASALADELFLMVKQGSLSREEVQDLVRTWFKEKLDRDLERRKHSHTSMSASKVREGSEGWDEYADLTQEWMGGAGAASAGFAQGVVEKDAFFADYDYWSLEEETRRELGHYVGRAIVQISRIMAARMRGEYQDAITDPFFNDSLPNAQPGHSQISTGLTLAEAIEQFQNDPQRTHLAPKTAGG